MKTKRNCLRFIALSIFLSAMLNSFIYSQGTESRRIFENKEQFCLGILVIPQQTSISMDGLSGSLEYTNRNSMNITFDAAYYFSRYIGVSFGAGLNSCSSEVNLPSYSTSFAAVDSESESYEMQIEGRSITEVQKISFLSIPVSIALRVPAGSSLGFFLNAGVSAEIPMVKTYDATGTFSYDGYYPAYPVTLEDIPTHGFPSNLLTEVSEDLEINSFNAALTTSAGIYFYLGSSFQIALGAHFSKVLSDIANYEDGREFYLTTQANELNSMMEGSTSAGVQAIGISLGLRYFLK